MANEFIIKNGFYSNGNSAITGSLIVSASGANNDLRIGTNKLFVSASGNVGIGTTTPSAKLEVVGSFKFGPTGPGSVYFRSWDYGTDMDISSVNVGGWARAHRIITSDTGGAVYFGVYGSTTTSERAYWTIGTTGSVEAGNTFTTGVHLLKNGNVGIGTYIPTAKLHITNTSTSASFIVEDDTQTDVTSFVIDANGNVGIGTTTPTAKLHVSGNAGAVNWVGTDHIYQQFYPSGLGAGRFGYIGYGFSGSTQLTITNEVAGGNLALGTVGNANRLFISASGNVGINTTSTTYTLQIHAAPTASIRLQETGSGGNKRLDLTIDGSATARISANQSAQSLAFDTSGGERLRITKDGDIGINTTTPLGKLTVSGSGGYLSYNDTDTAGNLLLLSGSSDELVRIDVSALSASAATTLSYGIRGVNETSYATYGKVTDGFMYASNFVNGLNIINYGEGTKEDYIRFYAGKNADGTTPDLHIQGSGSNKGFIGINKINPNAQLDVNGSTIITGSLTVTGGITGSITASGVFGPYGANSVISASFAVTASYFNATIQTSGSSIYSTNPAAGPNFNTTRGIFIGSGSGLDSVGSDKIAIGTNAGKFNTGTETVAIGERAGESNSTDSQVAIGLNAGRSNSGDVQIAIGQGAGLSNTGDSQTAVGSGAGSSNTGDYQTAVGLQAGYNNIGVNQVAIGFNAGADNSGDNQVAIGQAAGSSNTGSNNVNIGYQAGSYVNIGAPGLNFSSSNSVFLGADTAAGGAARINQIVIGYGTEGIGSNSVILGNTDIEVTALRGKVGVNKTTPNAQLDVNGDTIISGSLTVSGSYKSPSGNTIDSNALIQAGLLYLSNNF